MTGLLERVQRNRAFARRVYAAHTLALRQGVPQVLRPLELQQVSIAASQRRAVTPQLAVGLPPRTIQTRSPASLEPSVFSPSSFEPRLSDAAEQVTGPEASSLTSLAEFEDAALENAALENAALEGAENEAGLPTNMSEMEDAALEPDGNEAAEPITATQLPSAFSENDSSAARQDSDAPALVSDAARSSPANPRAEVAAKLAALEPLETSEVQSQLAPPARTADAPVVEAGTNERSQLKSGTTFEADLEIALEAKEPEQPELTATPALPAVTPETLESQPSAEESQSAASLLTRTDLMRPGLTPAEAATVLRSLDAPETVTAMPARLEAPLDPLETLTRQISGSGDLTKASLASAAPGEAEQLQANLEPELNSGPTETTRANASEPVAAVETSASEPAIATAPTPAALEPGVSRAAGVKRSVGQAETTPNTPNLETPVSPEIPVLQTPAPQTQTPPGARFIAVEEVQAKPPRNMPPRSVSSRTPPQEDSPLAQSPEASVAQSAATQASATQSATPSSSQSNPPEANTVGLPAIEAPVTGADSGQRSLRDWGRLLQERFSPEAPADPEREPTETQNTDSNTDATPAQALPDDGGRSSPGRSFRASLPPQETVPEASADEAGAGVAETAESNAGPRTLKDWGRTLRQLFSPEDAAPTDSQATRRPSANPDPVQQVSQPVAPRVATPGVATSRAQNIVQKIAPNRSSSSQPEAPRAGSSRRFVEPRQTQTPARPPSSGQRSSTQAPNPQPSPQQNTLSRNPSRTGPSGEFTTSTAAPPTDSPVLSSQLESSQLERPAIDPAIPPNPTPGNDAAQSPAPEHAPLERVELSGHTRRFLEPLVGFDPGAVNVYTGDAVTEIARDLRADAAAVDGDVLLPNATNLESPGQLGLLAHELVHVPQQRRFAPARSTDSDQPAPPGQPGNISASSAPVVSDTASWTSEESRARLAEARVARLAGGESASLAPAAGRWNGLPAPWEPMPDLGAPVNHTATSDNVISLIGSGLSNDAWGDTATSTSAPSSGLAPSPSVSGSSSASGASSSSGAQLAEQDRELPQGEAASQSGAGAAPDLEGLARQVYDVLKRKLAHERRRGG